MDKRDRESSENFEGSEQKIAFVVNTGNDRVRQLRQAYLDGQLFVDSSRLADKMIAFEQQLEIVFSDKDET